MNEREEVIKLKDLLDLDPYMAPWPDPSASLKIETNAANLLYFRMLDQKRKNHAQDLRPMRLKERADTSAGHLSLALLSDEQRHNLPVIKWSEISDIEHKKLHQLGTELGVEVWKLHAGLGTSFDRMTYLSHLQNVPPEQAKVSAKGLDLFVKVPGIETPVSLAEVHLLQLASMLKRDKRSHLYYRGLCSPDTCNDIINLSHQRPGHWPISYDHLAADRLKFLTPLIQFGCPTLDERNNWSDRHLAPSGHGFFGFYSVLETLLTNDDHLVCIGNGEDINSTPSFEVLGLVADRAVPVLMITTEKTPLDKKGGQICLSKTESGEEFFSIVERAQAEASGQLQLFEEMGLRPGDESSLFNTNTVVLNREALRPLLVDLLKKMDLETFLDRIAPDVIMNKKSKGGDQYTQVEGAMGSVLLNLDRLCREVLGRGCVYFLETSAQERIDFFVPIKTAFDFIYFHESDRFMIGPDYRLTDLAGGALAKVELKGMNEVDYNNLFEIQQRFNGASLKNLRSLKVEGDHDFSGKVLEGELSFSSK